MAIPFVLRANPVISGDCHTSGAPRSEFAMEMIAGGNHTIMWCALVRNDSVFCGNELHNSDSQGVTK